MKPRYALLPAPAWLPVQVLAAKPDHKKQGYMTFVKQDDSWKIKH